MALFFICATCERCVGFDTATYECWHLLKDLIIRTTSEECKHSCAELGW